MARRGRYSLAQELLKARENVRHMERVVDGILREELHVRHGVRWWLADDATVTVLDQNWELGLLPTGDDERPLWYRCYEPVYKESAVTRLGTMGFVLVFKREVVMF